MALTVKLARTKRSSSTIVSFLVIYTVIFLLVFWFVWAIAHSWNGSLLSSSLITFAITTPIALATTLHDLISIKLIDVLGFLVGFTVLFLILGAVIVSATREAHTSWANRFFITLGATIFACLVLSVIAHLSEGPKVPKPASTGMTFGKFIGYSFLFISECLIFGFFVFAFDSLFATWALPPFHQFDPIQMHFSLDIIITLLITISVFSVWEYSKKRTKVDTEAAAIAAQEERERSAKEIKDKELRQQKERERQRDAVHKFYLKRLEEERIADLIVKQNRAREIAELERELAHYQNIPSEPEADEQESE